MSRNPRRFSRIPARKENNDPVKYLNEVVRVSKENIFTAMNMNMKTANRSCFVTPKREDFSQITSFCSTEPSIISENQQLNNLVLQQYGLNLSDPGTIGRLADLRKFLCGNDKVENSCQHSNHFQDEYLNTASVDYPKWQNVESIDDIDAFINEEDFVEGEQSPFMTFKISGGSTVPELEEKNITISEVPRVKIIAEKFTKYKRNNIELRKLEEKVVCVEYDILTRIDNGTETKPVQLMRLFFSIKPNNSMAGSMGNVDNVGPKIIPSTIKRKFNISESDLQKLNHKEIEIIDAKIAENKPYLDDLKTLLKQQKAFLRKKNKSTLDLLSLYEIAKRKYPICDHINTTNILSKNELEEVKNLILKKSMSSVHGINRRTFKYSGNRDRAERDMNVISESLVAELLRQS